MSVVIIAGIVFAACWILVPIFFGILRAWGIYTTVEERECKVYVLFGDVVGQIPEPGLHFLFPKFGWKSFILPIFGQVYSVDLRLDQRYLRSQPVNSEEGAPMGIGVWYEMWIDNPLSFLFKNNDPQGSLAANVSNTTIRALSNLKLSRMLENRHEMSHLVREEVTPQSKEWGYRLGSIYIRKVHFRDTEMIHQIESKVVNRLRQVTAAIKQDGENQVNLISSAAEREAAAAFAQAAAVRPMVVGQALQEISHDPEIMDALFQVLENQKILSGNALLSLIPEGSRTDMITPLTLQTAGSKTGV
jgi:regulator of protease activity HflC (stomatin/prohibitin superfamily)